jgi:NAD(P)-dependent dehydrogenase (short-subunit alcohol dehydrogenase family)
MDGLTAVVTGAGRDVGEAVARRFAAEGARVVVAAREQDDLDELVADVEDEGGDAEGLRTDVRDEFDVERLMETAARGSDGGIDVVAACDEVYHGDPGETPLSGEAYSAFDDTLRTNARGTFATIKEALPHLADDARVLVPAGSVALAGDSNREGGSGGETDAGREADADRQATPGFGSYAVSKAAAEALCKGFAAELDQTVGIVDPGTVAIDSTGGRGREQRGRDPEDVADLYVWAATEASAEDVDGAVVGPAEFERATA